MTYFCQVMLQMQMVYIVLRCVYMLYIIDHNHWLGYYYNHGSSTFVPFIVRQVLIYPIHFHGIIRPKLKLRLVMLVSHSPDFDCRWTHEIGNLQIRLLSGTHRDIRVDILSHRVFIGVISQGSAATSGVVQKSLACQKIAR